MVEGRSEKLDKLQHDLQEVEGLYNFAAQLYPYSKIRSGPSVSISH
jgi:hypothetical protein